MSASQPLVATGPGASPRVSDRDIRARYSDTFLCVMRDFHPSSNFGTTPAYEAPMLTLPLSILACAAMYLGVQIAIADE
jgi:hypothetical protein